MLEELINGAVIHGWYERQPEEAAQMKEVSFVEPCYRGTLSSVRAMSTQDAQLDRVDQRELSRDTHLRGTVGGEDSRLYVLDTGVNLLPSEFAARASQLFVASGLGGGMGDLRGHGSQMGSIAAGSDRGLAYSAQVFSIKVGGANSADDTIDSDKVLEGLNFLAGLGQPGVVNMSLAVVRSATSPDIASMRLAVNNLTGQGYVVIAAAGNGPTGTPGIPITGTFVHSPAEVASAFTVAASNHSDGFPDSRLLTSNYGPEVDLFAPGTLRGRDHNNVLQTNSGSSGAAALVSGTTAAAREYRTGFNYAQSLDLLKARARTTPVDNSGSPNALGQLFTDLGTVERPALSLLATPATCLNGQIINVRWITTATVSDSSGNTYVAQRQDIGAACGDYGLSKGKANLRVQRFNASGSVVWTRLFADPDPTNLNINDSIADLAVNGDNTKLLLALSTADASRVSASVNHVFFSGNSVDAYGVLLETTSGTATWSVRLGTSAAGAASGIDLARTAFFSRNLPENAFIGGQAQGSFSPAVLVGFNDAFVWSGAATGGNTLTFAQFAKPGNVIINDGAALGTGAVLVGATNADPSSGAALPNYDELTIRQLGASVLYSTVANPTTDDEIVEVAKAVDTSGSVETLFVSRLSRTSPSGMNVARLTRLPDNQANLSAPSWTSEQQILSSRVSKLALTPEDVYWLAGPLLVKASRREGLTAFSESFLSGMTWLTLNGANGGETLWALEGSEVQRRKAR